MKVKERNRKIREDLLSKGIPEAEINSFLFSKYQVEYNEEKAKNIIFVERKIKLKKKRKEVDKKAYQKRKEDIKSTVIFRQKWREQRREYWRRREEWAALYSKCECVNSYFDGSEQHHISKFLTAFIPKNLHRSIYHSLRSGKNMLRLNDLVYEWLELHKK